MSTPVAVVMGSQSDWETMKEACDALTQFNVGWKAEVVSAHRTPQRMYDFAKSAHENGYKVIIAGAGGAAHLPGMIASLTPLPVLGVPVKSRTLSGWDSLLSIVQMPKGVAVGTLAIGAAAPGMRACWPPRCWRRTTPSCCSKSPTGKRPGRMKYWPMPSWGRADSPALFFSLFALTDLL